MQPEVIDKKCAILRDDVVYNEVLVCRLSHHERKLKVKIKSNPYDFQSSAAISHWTGEKWESIHTIIPTDMKTRPGLCYRKWHIPTDQSRLENEFQDDRNELLRVASAVLF